MKYIIYLILFSSSFSFSQENEIEKKYFNEIKAILKNKKVKKSYEYIIQQEPFTYENLIKLTEIEAPPFKEQNRAIEFKHMIEEIGIDSVWIDLEGNVVGLLKGQEGTRTVGLDAHLDTVFPEGTDVKVRIKNDTLYAPGIADDSRGLSMLLTILKTIRNNDIPLRDNLLFIGSVGEEGLGDLRGVKYLFRNGASKIDSWISIDGGSIGRVNNKGLGSYRYRVTFIGPGGHSWGSFGLVNPHHALGKAIQLFVNSADNYTSKGSKTSYNIGIIKGGTSINSIPFESIMEVDIRSVDPSRLDEMEEILQNSVKEALDDQNNRKRMGDNLTYVIDKIGNRPSGELSPSLPLVQRAMAVTKHFGVTPRLTRGSTNSNIPISLGIPSVTIGRGGKGGNVHSLAEWWYNDRGYRSIQLSLLLVLMEAGFLETK
ncbi:MAG: peptidase M20 [Flavobacteriaceae bacterium]|nr:peptidase M20 [Flavobacteriaceae bacterium]|tara:strand:- start:3559 stop:4842 length:1284 start_codon:yes stop_codon:yes gene_type:complete